MLKISLSSGVFIAGECACVCAHVVPILLRRGACLPT